MSQKTKILVLSKFLREPDSASSEKFYAVLGEFLFIQF